MFRFHNWKIYDEGRSLRLDIENKILCALPAAERFSLNDQLRRAMNSVILNIAEGSYRKSDKDFAHFLNQSQASLYEVVAYFDLLKDSRHISQEAHHEFLLRCESLAKQISAFGRHLVA